MRPNPDKEGADDIWLVNDTQKFAWYGAWNCGRTHHSNQARSLVLKSVAHDIRVMNLVCARPDEVDIICVIAIDFDTL